MAEKTPTPNIAINFTAANHRKSIDGLKDQTRRPARNQPLNDDGEIVDMGEMECDYFEPTIVDKNGQEQPGKEIFGAYSLDEDWGFKTRYKPGDIAALRTTWAVHKNWDTHRPLDLPKTLTRDRLWFESDGDKPEWCGKSRPAMFLPQFLWHLCPLAEITDVRVERLQAISEEDAIAEGLNCDGAIDVFRAAPGWREPVAQCWLETESVESVDGNYCLECAKKYIAKDKSFILCGGDYSAHESDGPAYCEDCSRPLLMSLTKYGIERELFLECETEESKKYFPARGNGASIAHMIASGIGDLHDEHSGRLAQIAFATLWDSINHKKHPWESNPFVEAYTYKMLVSP